jgi:peptidoglycan L-alanyl-D-glutamate endopeptidase CwlK
MYKFSKKSLDKLIDIHPKLVQVVHDAMALQIMDFSVNEGLRSLDRQKHLVRDGKSRTMRSKHLMQSDNFGHAVDLYPSPINMAKVIKGDMQEVPRFGVLAGIIKTCAKRNNVTVIWGGDWDNDGETLDHTFFDGPHFEIALR